MKTNQELRELVFNVIFECMFAAGGDGDSCLCCDNWKAAADEFEKWLKEKHPHFLKRKDNDDCVIFSDQQEGIIITNHNFEDKGRFVDCLIKTLHF